MENVASPSDFWLKLFTMAGSTIDDEPLADGVYDREYADALLNVIEQVPVSTFYQGTQELWTALDLDASPTRVFLGVVLPEVRASLLVGALVAFVVSVQEFVMALFRSAPDTRTVPVQAWNSLRGSLDPLVSVVSTVLLVAVVCLVVVAGGVVGLDRLATDT